MGNRTDPLPLDHLDRIDAICDAFEEAWSLDDRPGIAPYLEMIDSSLRARLLRALLSIELELLRQAGQVPLREYYQQKFPEHDDVVSEVFRMMRGMDASRTRLGNYELLDIIGRGGMGAVYKARHTSLDKLVAIKLLPHNFLKNPQAVARFRREMQAVGKLDHPNIIRAMDAGEVDGTHYLVMEFVEGIDLSRMVKERGPLTIELAVDFVIQAARGLDYAHRRGLVHRDIKPSNLLLVEDLAESQGLRSHSEALATSGNLSGPSPHSALSSDHCIKVLDLGLARIDDGNEQTESLTTTGTVMGTVDYMSPEQAEDMRKADARSDIYSLGCTLFFLLTGRAPFVADTSMKRLLAHRDAPIPSLSDTASHRDRATTKTEGNSTSSSATVPLPPVADADPKIVAALDGVIQRMLAKRPEDRLATMSDVISQLSKVLPTVGVPTATSSITALDLHRPKSVERPKWNPRLTKAIALVLLVIGAYSVWTFAKRPAPQQISHAARNARQETTNPPDTVTMSAVEAAASAVDSLDEPTPVSDWLRGREVLTVSQDGQGQFKSITAALQALKPGQAVKVLDRGPYNEPATPWLTLPKDTGLVSQAGTEIVFSQYRTQADTKGADGRSLQAGWILNTDGFRLSGIHLRANADLPAETRGLSLLQIVPHGELLIDRCRVALETDSGERPDTGNRPAWAVTSLLLYHDDQSQKARVTNSEFVGAQVSVTHTSTLRPRLDLTFDHNRIHRSPQGLVIGGPPENAYVVHNVIVVDQIGLTLSHNSTDKQVAANERMLAANNTILARRPLWWNAEPNPNLPIPTQVVILNNLLKSHSDERIFFTGVNQALRQNDREQAARNWRVGHNGYFGRSTNEFNFPAQPTDLELPASPLPYNADPSDPEFLRFDANSPLAESGAGGSLPQFIGALPPGPVPQDGDWLTEIEKRFSPPVQTEIPDKPLEISEPLPL